MNQPVLSLVKYCEDEELRLIKHTVVQIAGQIRNRNPLLTAIKVIREYDDGTHSCDVLTV